MQLSPSERRLPAERWMLCLHQVLIHKVHDRRIGDQLVLELDDAVPLVVEHQKADGGTPRLERLHQLLGLAQRHARVVCPVDHHQRSRDPVHVVDRCDALQEGAVVRQAAVLGLAVRAAVFAGVLQKGRQVADAHNVHARCP